jgi:hypothetical protein
MMCLVLGLIFGLLTLVANSTAQLLSSKTLHLMTGLTLCLSCHLGHYKAIIKHTILLCCFTQFFSIAIMWGIAIPRWYNATIVLIEKDPGQPRISRLQIIHLFEADLNLFLKIQWGHRLVRRACELNLLNSGQHGSVPGRTSMDPVMLTQIWDRQPPTDKSTILSIGVRHRGTSAQTSGNSPSIPYPIMDHVASATPFVPQHDGETHGFGYNTASWSFQPIHHATTPSAPLYAESTNGLESSEDLSSSNYPLGYV